MPRPLPPGSLAAPPPPPSYSRSRPPACPPARPPARPPAFLPAHCLWLLQLAVHTFCVLSLRVQPRSLQAGLTQKIALIQGPPGTGKTFLGIQIMRVLHARQHAAREMERGHVFPRTEPPILVVCYTNHALDQFLEGLLDAGITEIIRMGGK